MGNVTRWIPEPGDRLASRISDRELSELVDAIVEITDAGRDLSRVRAALEPFGGSRLFDAEVRINAVYGHGSDELCICGAFQ